MLSHNIIQSTSKEYLIKECVIHLIDIRLTNTSALRDDGIKIKMKD